MKIYISFDLTKTETLWGGKKVNTKKTLKIHEKVSRELLFTGAIKIIVIASSTYSWIPSSSTS